MTKRTWAEKANYTAHTAVGWRLYRVLSPEVRLALQLKHFVTLESVMQIAIELPDDFVVLQNQGNMVHEIRSSYALWLYQQGRVTLAKAAQLAGGDLYDFLQMCKLNQVATLDVSRDELLDELAGFERS